jgi:dihydroflavonol-4-reductase
MTHDGDAGRCSVRPGDPVAITGAAGFIGSAITRRLLDRGAVVTALIEPGGDTRNLDGLEVERRTVDVRDRHAVVDALDGQRFVFHTAALYSFWSRDPSVFSQVNVEGTRNVLEAADQSGCERVIYTSTVGTVGLHHTGSGAPADENCYADIAHLFGHYKRTKYVAEHEVLRAAAQGAPVVLVLPTFPLGPRDTRPTPTGQLVLDFLNGKIPGFVDTSLNVAHVDDLAEAHILAAERGRTGRSYIAGGENMAMAELLATLAAVTGLPAPTRRFPRALALLAGAVSESFQGRLLRRQPFVSMEAARMSTTSMIFDDSRARSEIGYSSRPAIEAITDSARWFVDHGYVRPARRSRISWPTPT